MSDIFIIGPDAIKSAVASWLWKDEIRLAD